MCVCVCVCVCVCARVHACVYVRVRVCGSVCIIYEVIENAASFNPIWWGATGFFSYSNW